jgi:hypothetical protein
VPSFVNAGTIADQALLRAYQWLRNNAHFPAKDDDIWQLPLVDCFYGTQLWDGSLASPGKNMGWTNWTHPQRGGCMRHRIEQP